jgi:hypothetical protein
MGDQCSLYPTDAVRWEGKTAVAHRRRSVGSLGIEKVKLTIVNFKML